MTDTERLDAIGEYGLCLIQHAELASGQWTEQWECRVGVERSVWAPTMREAIDTAVAVEQLRASHAAEERVQ